MDVLAPWEVANSRARERDHSVDLEMSGRNL